MNTYIGDWLRMKRNDKAMSREEVANLAGISATYVAQIEQGRKIPSPKVREALRAVFYEEDPIVDHNVGDIIRIFGHDFRVEMLTIHKDNVPTVVLTSLLKELEK